MSDVLIRVEGRAGRITLNRPRAMNALTLEMVQAMHAALFAWEADRSVALVVVDGAGDRGLCAGGDIRLLYDAAKGGDLAPAAAFFRDEYRLNYLISRYPKPYVAMMDGIVMGGGIGISAHGSHRVVSERSVLAMPEVSIGFAPDVGGTYLLGTAHDQFGVHLGLTGRRIGGADAILCGLADLCVDSAEIPRLTGDLQSCDSRAAVDRCLEGYSRPATAGLLGSHRSWIKECYARTSVEGIVAALEAHPDVDAAAAAKEISRNSPTSLKVTLRALREAGETRDLAACLRQEYRTSLTCLGAHDFVEGVRSAIVDKDRNPAWRPARLEDVPDELVAEYFAQSDADKLAIAV